MKFVIATHGDFAKGILTSLEMLYGPQEDVVTLGLYPGEEPEALGEKIAAELDSAPADGVVVFTDLFFGSPFNQAVNCSRDREVYHVTGLNLPVLIEAATARDAGQSCEEVCAAAMAIAPDSIKDVRALLAGQGQA